MDYNNDDGIVANVSVISSTTGTLSIQGSGGIKLPGGTTAQRPIFENGQLRLNTDTGFVEVSSNAVWVDIEPAGAQTLATLNDVTLTTPVSGNLLSYNGTTWINQTTVPGSASGVLNSWIFLSGNRYYQDFNHNLGTRDVVVTTYDNITNQLLQVDSIVGTTVNTVRVTVVGNSVAVRIVVIANGLAVGTILTNVENSLQVINAGGTTSMQEDLSANRPPAGTVGRLFIATDTKVLYRDTGVDWTVISAGTAGTLSSTTYYANSVDSPNTTDFAVTAIAPAISDPTNTAISVRSFSDTIEQGISVMLTPPVGAVSITFKTSGRASVAQASVQVVQPNVYFRAIPDNAAIGAWSAVTNFTAISIPANAYYQNNSQTFTLASLGLVPGTTYQTEFTRRVSGVIGGANLTTPWLLSALTIDFA